jgi:hypothetical protein
MNQIQNNENINPKKHKGLGFYKGWSPKERLKSLRYTKQAQARGLMPLPKKCVECGSTKNLQSHVPNYDFSINILPDVLKGKIEITQEIQSKLDNDLVPMCRKCHIALHKRENEEERKKMSENNA